MVWNSSPVTESDGRVKVTVESNGDVTGKKYAADTKIKDAVLEMANNKGIKNFVVEDTSGNEIDENRGDEPLSAVGNLTITPEAVGAQEEEASKGEEKPEEEKPSEDEKKSEEASE